MNMVRYPEFAGSFYPEDRKELVEMLDFLFQRAAKKKVRNTRAIIAPHAGYIYSGKIAASSYMQLKNEDIETILILGPSHHYAFYGASVWKEGKWITPIGETEIDTQIANKLLNSSEFITDNITYHSKEHSLEVQLPFIQYLFGEKTKIVPLVFGFPKTEMLTSVSNALSDLLGMQKIGFVISSDLYHGYSYDDALQHDALTRDLILKIKPQTFFTALLNEEAMACGGIGITAFLMAINNKNIKAHFIDYTNSAETTGDFTGYVVGYLSIAFSEEG